MALKIEHPEVDKLASELVGYTGETITQALINALRERLARERAKRGKPPTLRDEILRIGRECAALPVIDDRPPDEIIGYDEYGAPS